MVCWPLETQGIAGEYTVNEGFYIEWKWKEHHPSSSTNGGMSLLSEDLFSSCPRGGWPSRSLDWDMQDGPLENSWQLPNRNHCNVGKTIMNHPQFHHKYIGGTNHQNVEDLLNLLSFWPHYTWFSNGMATFTVAAFGMMNPNDCRHSPSMS